MKRSSKKIVAAIATLAAIVGQAAPAVACGGRGGFSGGFGASRAFSRSSVSLSRPVSYASPSRVSYGYSQPTYTTPIYQHSSTTVMQSQYGSVPQRVLTAPQTQAALPTQSMAQTQMPATGVTTVPQSQGQSAQSVTAAQPQASKSTQVNNVKPSQSSASGSAANNENEQSALAMLASIAAPTQDQSTAASVPQFSPAATSEPTHIGTWVATLPNEASIQLQLSQAGQFNWTATQNGKTSTFAGEYQVVDGRLILVRSGDRQELKGSWVETGKKGFSFKLDGSKDGGLNFQRG